MMKFGNLYISKCRLLMIVLYLILLGLMFAPCMEELLIIKVEFTPFPEGASSMGTKSYFNPFFAGLILLGALACLSQRFWAGILRMISGLLLLGLMLVWPGLLSVLAPMGGLGSYQYVLNAPGICCVVLAAGINVTNIISLVEQRRKKEDAAKES